MQDTLHYLLSALSSEVLSVELQELAIFRRSLLVKTSQGVGLATRDPLFDQYDFKRGISLAHYIEQMDYANLAHRSISLAILNSLACSTTLPTQKGQNFLLTLPPQKRIAVIGRFPFVEKLRQSNHFSQVDVFELEPLAGEFGVDNYELLSTYDTIFLTAMTLMNNTFDRVLAYCQGVPTVIMGGPTTPLYRELFSRGITHLAGSEIIDAKALKETLTQGLSFRHCKGLRPIILSATGDQ